MIKLTIEQFTTYNGAAAPMIIRPIPPPLEEELGDFVVKVQGLVWGVIQIFQISPLLPQ